MPLALLFAFTAVLASPELTIVAAVFAATLSAPAVGPTVRTAGPTSTAGLRAGSTLCRRTPDTAVRLPPQAPDWNSGGESLEHRRRSPGRASGGRGQGTPGRFL